MKATKRGRPLAPETEERYRREAQFCLNNCPRPEKKCNGKIKQCMAQKQQREEV